MSAVSLPQPRKGLRDFVESKGFNHSVTALIIINAITLGLETSQAAMAFAGPLLYFIDRAALIIFTIEISLRIWVYRTNYFKDFWGIFDFLVVAIAWIPASGPLSVLRALRILRVLRLVSIVPQMRKVVGALLHSLPGMGSIVAVLLLVFYVGAVMATKLFGGDFPDWFGSIGASMYTLFQIMTLESWSMGIVRPVMQEYPLAWMFFEPFIIVTSFAVLNLFIALVVNSMQSLHDQTTESVREEAIIAHDEREALQRQLARISEDLEKIRAEVARR
ncbi:MAG: ion transporter [Woeseiaceae bacterium]|nr:ion transporter [Woeseiaceae bacterium]